MNKLLATLMLVTYNCSAETSVVKDLVDMYGNQPTVIYVQPYDRYPTPPSYIQPIRSTYDEGKADFMLPKVHETPKIDLLGDING